MVFVHGMGGDRTTWHGQLAALADRFTAVSVDLRGYGDSETARGPLDFRRDFAADLVTVIDHFGLASAHLVGLSMGGRVARWAALLHPDRVASLTLANTSAGFDALTPAQVEQFIAARTFRPHGDAMPAGYGTEQARAMMAPGTPEPLLRQAGRPLQGLSASHYFHVLRASTQQDRGARLEDIACPVHLITSDLDRVYPPEVTLEMRNRLRDAHFTCITQAGHLSNVEQPQAFNRALRDFLLQQAPPQAAQHAGD
ncbi:MAG: alpha/beta hydrolase fold [Ramlibacter sp.]|nr:alpha/beta hydrolase fold [Ramlibacter sp.]